MIIFKHTFRKMLTLKFLIIYFLIFIPIFIGFTLIFNANTDGAISYGAVKDQLLANYFIVSFMWTLGIPFLISTASRGSALIQQEVDDETLVLLVSKPITRKRIFFEKWLASYTISVIIGLLSILLSLSLYIIILNVDSMILLMFIKLIPSLFIYILFINLIITAIAMFVTALFKNRVRSIITLVVFIMVFQLIFPIFTPMLREFGRYESYRIYLFDINYHFGIMYYTIISLFSTVRFTPLTQIQISQLIGIFQSEQGHNSDQDLGFLPDTFEAVNYISPVLIFLIWIMLSGLFMYYSYRILRKQDIN